MRVRMPIAAVAGLAAVLLTGAYFDFADAARRRPTTPPVEEETAQPEASPAEAPADEFYDPRVSPSDATPSRRSRDRRRTVTQEEDIAADSGLAYEDERVYRRVTRGRWRREQPRIVCESFWGFTACEPDVRRRSYFWSY